MDRNADTTSLLQLMLLLEEGQPHVQEVDQSLVDVGRELLVLQSPIARGEIADEMSMPAPRPLVFGETGFVFHNLQERLGARGQFGHQTGLRFGVSRVWGGWNLRQAFGFRKGQTFGGRQSQQWHRVQSVGMSKVYHPDAGFISFNPSE